MTQLELPHDALAEEARRQWTEALYAFVRLAPYLTHEQRTLGFFDHPILRGRYQLDCGHLVGRFT